MKKNAKKKEAEKTQFDQRETNALLKGLELIKNEINKVAKLAKEKGLDDAFKAAEKEYVWIEELKTKLL